MKSESGFSLVELMVAMAVMLLISGAAVTALLKLTTTQSTIWNRTQMHSGIRGATEVLQQEVGQAGRVSLPAAVTLTSGTALSATSLPVTSTAGMFVGEQLTVGTGSALETVTVTAVPSSTSLTIAAAGQAHSNLDPVVVLGGFSSGIVPTTTTNGSTAAVLKLFGDVNSDGNMVYVEYSVSPSCICSGTCSPSTTTGNLYRNSMAWNAASKTPAAASQILLSNVTANPNGTACFTYQPESVSLDGGVTTTTYVTDVAVTLTVQTQLLDPVTRTYQTETKALLNVSPRNVFNTWELHSSGYSDRVQPTPPSITTLLAGPS